MQKVLEFPLGNGEYSQTKVTVQTSRNGNLYVKHNGVVYVFTDPKTGTPVMQKINGKWATVGRMAPFTIFIGEPDQLTYDEYKQTPEGKAKIEENFNNFMKDLQQFREVNA